MRERERESGRERETGRDTGGRQRKSMIYHFCSTHNKHKFASLCTSSSTLRACDGHTHWWRYHSEDLLWHSESPLLQNKSQNTTLTAIIIRGEPERAPNTRGIGSGFIVLSQMRSVDFLGYVLNNFIWEMFNQHLDVHYELPSLLNELLYFSYCPCKPDSPALGASTFDSYELWAFVSAKIIVII